MQAPDGNFYGTAVLGIEERICITPTTYISKVNGSVFKMTPSGAVTLLHKFKADDTEGRHLTAGLVEAEDGNLYGTTYRGGVPLGTAAGTFFRLTPSGTLTTLHVFTGPASGGRAPFADLLQASDGNLYGTTAGDGGAIFRITTAGAVTPLHFFADSGDALPVSGLTEASDGFLYGTTYLGGDAGELDRRGTIYRIGLDGDFKTLYQFQDRVFGLLDGVVEGNDGDFYGTGANSARQWLVYKVSASGELTRLHTFRTITQPPLGSHPVQMAKARDGSFAGTTSLGGLSNKGIIFRMTPSGTGGLVHHFGGDDGAHPTSAPIEGADGGFYGTTIAGGSHGSGTVYRWTPAGLTTLYSFSGPDGEGPRASLVEGDDGNFYGTTIRGGAGGRGTIFKITPSGALTTLYSLTDGNFVANHPLIQATDGAFYGTSLSSAQGGILFRVTPSGEFTTVHAFDFENQGCAPEGVVQANDGNFYVPIWFNIFPGCLVNAIFRVTRDGVATTVYEVDGDGRVSGSSLKQASDGALYGMLLGEPFGSSSVIFRLVLE